MNTRIEAFSQLVAIPRNRDCNEVLLFLREQLLLYRMGSVSLWVAADHVMPTGVSMRIDVMRNLNLACSLLAALALSFGASGCAEQPKAPETKSDAPVSPAPATSTGPGSTLGGGAEVPAAPEKPATPETPAAPAEAKPQ